MKKSTKISGQIPQIGLDLLLENSQEINSKEMELQNKIASEKQNKIANFIKNTLDFATGGNFSIYNDNDNTRLKITENQFKILGKTQELIEKSKLPIKLIDLKLQHNFRENLSLEGGETLQNMWANMLANALTGKIEIEVSYIKILAELSEFDVYILNLIYEILLEGFGSYNFNSRYERANSPILISEPLINKTSKTEKEIKISLDTLFSKKLIESLKIHGNENINIPLPLQSSSYNHLCLSYLGENFVKCCRFNAIDSTEDLDRVYDNPVFNRMRLQ